MGNLCYLCGSEKGKARAIPRDCNPDTCPGYEYRKFRFGEQDQVADAWRIVKSHMSEERAANRKAANLLAYAEASGKSLEQAARSSVEMQGLGSMAVADIVKRAEKLRDAKGLPATGR